MTYTLTCLVQCTPWEFNMSFVFHFYILGLTSWIQTNPSKTKLIWGLQSWTLSATKQHQAHDAAFKKFTVAPHEREQAGWAGILPIPFPSLFFPCVQGSGDFWAQPAKILPFTTSTGFLQDLTGCKLVAIHLDRPISYNFFQAPANVFFTVITTGQERGHW